ncbi:hypothetical protein DPMN_028693 [Dreissena polymorpha]|uniref:Uncharacterized protein n=1 Tax=Dreissena polymorpha TaxID=45954 RepID=A0A9D4REK8_DREPO|nr:hypothetical protein DPMN_028693 [Dreissena polymorpha]
MDEDCRVEMARELDEHHIPHEYPTDRSMLADGDNRKGWIIVIVSKESLKLGVLSFNLMKCLTVDVDEGQLRVLLVLRSGVNISDVPMCIRWVTCFSADENSYKNCIVKTVSGAPVDIGKALPAGDVIPGLCWAYVLNYLKIVLTTSNIYQTIQAHLTSNDLNCGCIRKLIVVWVKSCDMDSTLDFVANKSGGRRKITNSGQVKVTTNSLGGQIGRPFDLQMFRYTDELNPGNQCAVRRCVTWCEEYERFKRNWQLKSISQNTVQLFIQ